MRLSYATTRLYGLMQRLRNLWAICDRWFYSHGSIIYWTFGCLYKLSLDVMYIWGASPSFSYGGLIYTPNGVKYLFSNVLYLAMLAYLPRQEKDITAFLLHLQFVFILAPMMTVYGLVDHSTLYMLFVFGCAMLQIYLLKRPVSRYGRIHIRRIQNYVTVAFGILVVFCLITPMLYNGILDIPALINGFREQGINYVYQIRDTMKYPIGFDLMFNWMAKVVLPFGLVMFLERKQYLLSLLCMFAQILLFLETGHKLLLFMVFPIVFIYFFAKLGHLIKLMYIGLTVLCLITVLTYQMDVLTNHPIGNLLCGMVAVRAFLGPANNKFLFYNCFSEYPKLYFSDGQIGSMFGLTYPYAGGNGQVIYAYDGGEFLGSNSCTGYWGDAYSQMGFLGVFLMALLFAAVLRGIQQYDRNEVFPILAGLFSVQIIMLNDNALLTTLFTNGMLLAFLLVLIYLSESAKGANNGIQRL